MVRVGLIIFMLNANDLKKPTIPPTWIPSSLVVGMAENTRMNKFMPSINITESLGLPISKSPPDFLISSKIDKCLWLVTNYLVRELNVVNASFLFILQYRFFTNQLIYMFS